MVHIPISLSNYFISDPMVQIVSSTLKRSLVTMLKILSFTLDGPE